MIQDRLNIFHIDLNFVDLEKTYLRDWLMKLKDMGFNAILWELEDKVQWETCPECAWLEAMSKDEFRGILDYSRKLGLEPIPLLQTVGHAEYVLLQEKYHSFRELDDRQDCYCTSNAEVTKFLRSWVEEYIDLFGDIRYFHLGGDEAYVFGKCPKCSAYAEKHGRNKLFGNHIRALAEPVLKNNIRPGIWNDMIMKDPEALGFDNENYVIWDWNYWDTDKTPEKVNLHALGQFTKKNIGESEVLKGFPELVDEKGDLRSFASVQILKKYGFDVILCSSSRSHGDTFFCPVPGHAANIIGAAKAVESGNLLGHCVTSWAIRLNDYNTQIPYIGLATYTGSRTGKSSDELLYGYCRELFGTDPEKFIEAVKLLGVSLTALTVSVQWNGMKDSLPAPKGYLEKHLAKIKKINPEGYDSFSVTVEKALVDIPEGMRLLSEFFSEAKKGTDIVDAWLTGARFLLSYALIAGKILKKEGNPEIAGILKKEKSMYAAFLELRETPLSAMKNSGLVYDILIDYFSK